MEAWRRSWILFMWKKNRSCWTCSDCTHVRLTRRNSSMTCSNTHRGWSLDPLGLASVNTQQHDKNYMTEFSSLCFKVCKRLNQLILTRRWRWEWPDWTGLTWISALSFVQSRQQILLLEGEKCRSYPSSTTRSPYLMLRGSYCGGLCFQPLDAELRVSAVVPQRNGCLTDVTFLLEPVEDQNRLQPVRERRAVPVQEPEEVTQLTCQSCRRR